jgi:hypothetical protein
MAASRADGMVLTMVAMMVAMMEPATVALLVD